MTQTIETKSASAEDFARYGRLAVRPSGDPLAADDTFAFWSDVAHYGIEGDTEIGYCTVFRSRRNVIDWMERHDRTPEILIPIDAPIVLPVMDETVEAFRIEPGQAAVIEAGVWHSACKPVGVDQATYFVLFRRGTPREDVTKTDIEPVVVSYG